MCYGYDGDAALKESLARRGIDRRNFLRGSLAGLAGAGLAATGLAGSPAAAAGMRRVPHGQISIQLWTVRNDLFVNYDSTLGYLSEIGYPNVEQALGYFGRSAAQLRAFHDSLGIRTMSSHDGISGSQADLETKIENALTLGQSAIVVPFLSSPNEADWRMWAEQMNAEAVAAREAGLQYGYHNHAHEFSTDLGGGLRPWEVLTEDLDPRFVHLEIDIYWAVTGGIQSGDGVDDPEGFTIDVMREAPQRVQQYHVKDRDPTNGEFADPGTGHIDFARVFAAQEVQQYIVENDTPDVTPRQTAEVGYRYLRDLRF
ncbi:MAG TPA: sugar phosphate isomerase/epimerase [Nocardioidaceae bacterium]|nr:sugar phosphate isomerase/epimerase [Nocardioidaceae bacterium]